jgi:hypothetical protein
MRKDRSIILVAAMALASGTSAAQNPDVIEPLAGRCLHVAARGEIGFVAVTAGLKTVDLSDPGRPLVLAVLPLPQSATSVIAQDGLVFVAQGPAGLFAVDTVEPSAPSIVSAVDTPGSAMGLDFSGDLLAVADGSAGVALFDVSDARHPRGKQVERWAGGYCRGVRFHRSRLYACAGRTGITVFAGDRGGRWRRVGSCPTAGDAREIAFEGTTAAVADGKSGISLLDVSNTDEPKLVGTTPVGDFAHGVAFCRGFLYVAAGIDGVGVYRLSDRTTLEPLSRLDMLGGYANKITVDGSHLLVANDTKGILVFDITDPGVPKRVE